MPKSREIIIEYLQVGRSLRVTAVDVETGTEVIFQAPANAAYSDLQKTAISKMKYVLNKQKS